MAEQHRIVAILDEAFEGIARATASVNRNIINTRALFTASLDEAVAGGNDWTTLCFENCIQDVRYTTKVQRRDFKSSGAYPIISQEAGLVNGCWDREVDLFKVTAPIVIFGDHTRVLKFVDFDFVLGADGVKLLKPISELDPKFFFYAIMSKRLEGVGYARHYRLLKETEIAFPSLREQRSVALRLSKIEAELLNSRGIYSNKLADFVGLKHSLLARAFSGELTASSKVTTKPANNNVFATPEQVANVLAFVHWRHETAKREKTFGHVKAQKALHLVESVGGVELGRTPLKAKAGPNDFPHMLKAEGWAKDRGFFEFVKRPEGGYDFVKLANHDKMLTAAKVALKPIEDVAKKIADLLLPLDFKEAEVLATVHAAWNNLILDGRDATDDAILREARENWHARKLKIPETKFRDTIRLIRQKGIIPDGSAKRVPHAQPRLPL